MSAATIEQITAEVAKRPMEDAERFVMHHDLRLHFAKHVPWQTVKITS